MLYLPHIAVKDVVSFTVCFLFGMFYIAAEQTRLITRIIDIELKTRTQKINFIFNPKCFSMRFPFFNCSDLFQQYILILMECHRWKKVNSGLYMCWISCVLLTLRVQLNIKVLGLWIQMSSKLKPSIWCRLSCKTRFLTDLKLDSLPRYISRIYLRLPLCWTKACKFKIPGGKRTRGKFKEIVPQIPWENKVRLFSRDLKTC